MHAAAKALILVVDDHADIRAMLQLVLEQAGYEVLTAESGVQALALQRRRAAQVVITDLFMPEQDGAETIDLLRREFPATRIVAMSGGGRVVGRGGVDYLTAARNIGAHATLRKPFDAEELLQVVQDLLSG